jgi:hypothetical protein
MHGTPKFIAATLALLCASVIAQTPAAPIAPAGQEEWLALFNGRDLTGWIAKIAKHPAGDNYANTFRVTAGVLQASYDGYDKFDGQFGHIYYGRPFSYYRLRVEYRFVGQGMPDPPGPWAIRNSGVMLHSQAPATLGLNQNFPISVEAQFLGGLSDGKPRPTLNVCTPATEIVVDNALYPQHCLNSRSPTLDGDQWVHAEVVVLGSGLITHYVNGEKVLEYSMAQIGGGAVSNFDPAVKQDGKLLDSGYIALQAESSPVEFRNVQLLNLAGCMDQKAANYQKYFVKSQPETCRYR